MERLKILVVEDSMVFQEFYREVLANEIFEKRFSDDGEDGLQVYQSWKPDIILLDMVLPAMSGRSVLKEIRQLHSDTTTAVIIQTTLADKKEVMACMQLGIQGYVVKPPDADGISAKILQCYGQTNPDRAMVAEAELKRLANIQPSSPPMSPKTSSSPEEAMEFEPANTQQETAYIEEARFCLEAGNLTNDARKILDEFRKEMEISKERAAELEILAEGKS